MKFDAVRVNSAPEALAEQIIRQIKGGRLKAGDCLPSQRELAKAFGVGLGSVREAIKILNVMGHIDVIRGKGTFVSSKQQSNGEADSAVYKAFEAVSLADLMKARAVVEVAAARMAAENAHEDDVLKLRDVTHTMQESFTDTESFYQLDFTFHLMVAEAADNKAIYEIVKLLVDRAHNYIGFMNDALSISMPFNVEKAVASARAIVEHIAAGDAEKAGEAMYEHLNIVNWELKKEFLEKPVAGKS